MDLLRSLLLILHLLSWAIVFGLSISGMKQRQMPKGLTHGAAGALVTGALLVGVIEMGDLSDLNHMKIGIKLVVAAAVTALAFGGARKEKLTTGFFASLAGLVVVNVAIAVLL